MPDGVSADWAKDRAALWNAVESTEKRKDARVARMIVFAIPHEIPAEAKKRYSVEFCQVVADKYGTVVDLSIHAPPVGGDPRNWHGHGLMSTREIEADGFGAKTVILDSAKTSGAEIMAMRKINAEMTNRYLREAGFSDRDVSELPLIDQGITDRVAGEHMGQVATAIERRGEVSEKRTNHEARLPEKLEAAAEAGELVREIEAADEQLQAANDAGGFELEPELEKLDERLQSVNDAGELDRELEKSDDRIIVLDGNLQAAIRERDKQERDKQEREKREREAAVKKLAAAEKKAGQTTLEKAIANRDKNQQTPLEKAIANRDKNQQKPERKAAQSVTGEKRPETKAAKIVREYEQDRGKRLTKKMQEYRQADKVIVVKLDKAEATRKKHQSQQPEPRTGVFAWTKQAEFKREYAAWQKVDQTLDKQVRGLAKEHDRLERGGEITAARQCGRSSPRWKRRIRENERCQESAGDRGRGTMGENERGYQKTVKEIGERRGKGHDQGIGD